MRSEIETLSTLWHTTCNSIYSGITILMPPEKGIAIKREGNNKRCKRIETESIVNRLMYLCLSVGCYGCRSVWGVRGVGYAGCNGRAHSNVMWIPPSVSSDCPHNSDNSASSPWKRQATRRTSIKTAEVPLQRRRQRVKGGEVEALHQH